MIHKKQGKVSIRKVFALQDGAFDAHVNNNNEAYSYLQNIIELSLNRNEFTSDADDCNKESLDVFEVLFPEILSSFIVSIRVGFWGAATDSYSIFRNVMEGLGFINNVAENNEFEVINKLLQEEKLRQKHIDKRIESDRKLVKHLATLSNLASHFNPKRIAQRTFVFQKKRYARIATAFYEQEGALSKRLGIMLDGANYCIGILEDFYKNYHPNCVNKEFYEETEKLKTQFDKLVKKLNSIELNEAED